MEPPLRGTVRSTYHRVLGRLGVERRTSDGRERARDLGRRVTVIGGALAAVAAAAWAAAATWRARPFRVEVAGPSMSPTLEAGDWVLATAPGRLRRGHVVVVEHPQHEGFEIVKRVIAIPGDMAPDGRVLASGEYWVEGDDATASTDSRQFGPLRLDRVVGRARLVYWPRERLRVL